MTNRDRVIATIRADGRAPISTFLANQIADRLAAEGLIAQGYIGEIDAGDWELATIRLDIDRQMFKDGQVRMGSTVLVVPQAPKAENKG